MLEELQESLAGMSKNYDYNENIAGTVKKFLKKINEIQQNQPVIGVPKRPKRKAKKTKEEIEKEEKERELAEMQSGSSIRI